MRYKLKIFYSLLFVFSLFEKIEIKAHNTINGGYEETRYNFINKKGNLDKFKHYKNNEKLIREENSCVNNSLCRG